MLLLLHFKCSMFNLNHVITSFIHDGGWQLRLDLRGLEIVQEPCCTAASTGSLEEDASWLGPLGVVCSVPWGCVDNVIGGLSLRVICARGSIRRDQLTAVPSVKGIPNLHFVASRTSLTNTGARRPCGVSWQLHTHGLSRYNGLKWLCVSVVEVLLTPLHAHYGSRFFFCWVSRLKQCTRHRQQGLTTPTEKPLCWACSNTFCRCIPPIK